MKGFYIDSATRAALIVLFEYQTPIGFKKIEVGPLAKENLFEVLDVLFKENNLEFSDLDYVGLGIGPGSYTGMRVASSVGATLSYSLNIPLMTLTSMDGYEGDVVAFDAKRGQFYVKVGDQEPQLMSSEQLQKIKGKIVTPADSEPNLEKIGRLLFNKLQKKEFTDPKNVQLLYLQAPYTS